MVGGAYDDRTFTTLVRGGQRLSGPYKSRDDGRDAWRAVAFTSTAAANTRFSIVADVAPSQGDLVAFAAPGADGIERYRDTVMQQSEQPAAPSQDAGTNETLTFYRELRDVAIESAHTGSPLTLLVFESDCHDEAGGDGHDLDRSWFSSLRESLQSGLRDCERLVSCGAGALFLILLGSELEDAERRVADLNRMLPGGAEPYSVGVAQREDCEPLSHFVQRTRATLRPA